MTSFPNPSEKQKELFRSIAGYPFPPEHKGYFRTDRPDDRDDWKMSPFHVSYQYHSKTGYLFMDLTHRMTNNNPNGWDQEGNPLDKALIHSIYPSEIEQMMQSTSTK